MVCLQPVLVHYFGASQSFMANVALAYCGVAVIPPLIIALIANRLSSRSIVIIGLWLKVVLGFLMLQTLLSLHLSVAGCGRGRVYGPAKRAVAAHNGLRAYAEGSRLYFNGHGYTVLTTTWASNYSDSDRHSHGHLRPRFVCTLFFLEKRRKNAWPMFSCFFYTLGLAVGNIVGSHVYNFVYGEWIFMAFGGGLVCAMVLFMAPPFYYRLDPTGKYLRLDLLNAKVPPPGTVQI
jgi:hypothetical protein